MSVQDRWLDDLAEGSSFSSSNTLPSGKFFFFLQRLYPAGCNGELLPKFAKDALSPSIMFFHKVEFISDVPYGKRSTISVEWAPPFSQSN